MSPDEGQLTLIFVVPDRGDREVCFDLDDFEPESLTAFVSDSDEHWVQLDDLDAWDTIQVEPRSTVTIVEQR